MDVLLLVLAIAAQGADARLTCKRLNSGTHVEKNAFAAQTCTTLVVSRGAMLAGATLLPKIPQRWVLGGLAGAGTAGVTLSLTVGR